VQRRILVFSPDKDLANSLSLLLEGQYAIVCETKVENLGNRIRQNALSLLLIDLSSFPGDIRKVLEILSMSNSITPIVMLHVFQRRVPELEVDAIGQAITTLLETE